MDFIYYRTEGRRYVLPFPLEEQKKEYHILETTTVVSIFLLSFALCH